MDVSLFNLHQHKTNVLSFKLGNGPVINNSDGFVCMCVCVCDLLSIFCLVREKEDRTQSEY